MALKKDKQKVLGEVFDDERVKGFLQIEDRQGINSDFLRLERAYRGMNIDNFTTFVKFFVEQGCDLNAANENGKTFLQIISQHRHAQDYIDSLKSAGAKY